MGEESIKKKKMYKSIGGQGDVAIFWLGDIINYELFLISGDKYLYKEIFEKCYM